MSAVSQVVPTTAPGVPAVPNPPGPSFHPSSLNEGITQSSPGALNVYRQTAACFCEVGTASITSLALSAASVRVAQQSNKPHAAKTHNPFDITRTIFITRNLHFG